MMKVADKILAAQGATILNVDQGNQYLQLERGGFVFAVNLNPADSSADCEFPVHKGGGYRLILSSDDADFGGYHRTDSSIDYPAVAGRVKTYLPSRTIMVFALKE